MFESELSLEQQFQQRSVEDTAKQMNREQLILYVGKINKLRLTENAASKAMLKSRINGEADDMALIAFYSSAKRFLEFFDSCAWVDEISEAAIHGIDDISADKRQQQVALVYRVVTHILALDSVESMRMLLKHIDAKP